MLGSGNHVGRGSSWSPKRRILTMRSVVRGSAFIALAEGTSAKAKQHNGLVVNFIETETCGPHVFFFSCRFRVT